ncbi:MAG: exodeoxyribonuclease VII large subunit, partial [Clostridia bacterium]|nr:exodeoxyribonuclease VII large subunit [Clostridia bacterium]
GKGLLAIQLEMLKQKLQKDGYFDDQYKKPIPPYPTNVCVITSFNGAVIRDIKKTIRRKNDLINIFIKDVRVQGAEASNDIIKSLEQVDKMGYDVLIIARGGGSAEELMSFNDESLVKAIFKCKTPIISAVGHETDVTLCDLVADYRAATPTAAAEYIAYDTTQLKEYFAAVLLKMSKCVNASITDGERELKNKLNFINSQMKLKYSSNKHVIEQYLTKLNNTVKSAYTLKEHYLANTITKLQALNPLGILQKGYWYMSKDGNPVTSVKSIKMGDNVSLQTSDGKIKAQVVGVENEI